ncbi:hypothetical protein [Pseudobutyrivibrio ruminis]|uniref:Uncharacterized protein n=1 Tax=Pseudobutyrivibrio ruminis DSM 9787 TaxID=1123011 RepID=A0A285SAQ9_9FIRM|nr:hypothetical protein [Pseudobutyrivibrio ruminis]SOC04579.1 hypothetical protein SAMN02910411_2109 [Pseudobutyrivibrio ruminis DSM 9787]
MIKPNRVIVIVGIVIILMFLFCIKALVEKNSDINSAEDLFSNEFDQLPDAIVIYGFDEKEYEIDSEEDIESIVSILKNYTYIEMADDETVEGFYMLEFKYSDETKSIGVNDSYVSYEGKQYKVADGDLKQVVDLIVTYMD